MARGDGSHAKLLDRLSRLDLPIIDDWAMAALTEAGVERRDFSEICDGRYQVHPTLPTSQLPGASWHPQIGDPTVADSILDRLVHNAHRIELKSESMRKKRNTKTGEESSRTNVAQKVSACWAGQGGSNAAASPRTPSPAQQQNS